MRRIKEVDGLRGIAIALVLVWHFFPNLPIPAWTIPRYLVAGMRLAWSGVDLFFVISGFLIGGILLDNRDSSRYYATFYKRRFFRIVPAYAAVCVVVLLAAIVLPRGVAYGRLFNDQAPILALATFTQNFWMSAHHTFGGMALAPVWSLGVEEQFYLVLPLLIRHVSRRTLIRVLVACVVLAPVVRAGLFITGPGGWLWSQMMMPARADAFAIGILIALVIRDPSLGAAVVGHKRALLVIAVAAAGVLVLLTQQHMDFRSMPFATLGYSALAIVYGSILLAAVTRRDRWLNYVLSASPLRALGGIAYGVYLLHTFVWGSLFTFLPAFTPWPHSRTAADVGIVAIAFVITIIIATASWRWFEKPLIAIGHRSAY
jgi:peptidoglycan/LPS O-acetylase OafA/YrhL